MNAKEKTGIKTKIGLAILAVIGENKIKARGNKANGIKDPRLVDSLRKLAASSGVDFANVQKITAGTANPTITTIAAIAEGLNISVGELFQYYETVSKSETLK